MQITMLEEYRLLYDSHIIITNFTLSITQPANVLPSQPIFSRATSMYVM